MKQHITPKQLNELSKKGKERLRKWWKPKEGDFVYGENRYLEKSSSIFTQGCTSKTELHCSCGRVECGDVYKKSEALPLLSIGQMIEFLMKHDKHRTFISWNTVFDVQYIGRTWFGKIELDKKNVKIVFRDGYGMGELVDTLWYACKEILK